MHLNDGSDCDHCFDFHYGLKPNMSLPIKCICLCHEGYKTPKRRH